MADQTFKGVWQIANDPNQHVFHGELSITEEGLIQLELIDVRENFSKSIPNWKIFMNDINHFPTIPIISGTGKGGQDNNDLSFSLINCNIINYNSSALVKIKIEAEYSIDLYRIQNQNELLFKSLYIKLRYFNKWVGVNGFKLKKDNQNPKFNVTLDYQSPDPINVIDNQNAKVYFFHRATAPFMTERLTDFNLKEELFLNIEFSTKQSLEHLVDTIFQIQFLFSLLMNREAARESVQLRFDETHQHSTTNLTFYEYLNTFQKPINPSPNYLFNYEDLESNFGELLINWFSLTKKKGLAIKLFSDLFYQKNQHIISKFLGYISVMEIYFLQKPTLKKKVLMPLLEKCSCFFNLYIDNIEKFADTIVSVRIYYTHGSNRGFDFQYTNTRNVMKLCQLLELLFHGFILLEIGVSEDLVKKSFNKSIAYSHLKL